MIDTARWTSGLRYLFEDYALDTDRRELSRGTALIPLTPQVFDLLKYVIRNRERVVSKDDLIAARSGAGVSFRIRRWSPASTRPGRAIGDSGEQQRLIKTLPRKGIRFVGSVREEEQPGGRRGRIQPQRGTGRSPCRTSLRSPSCPSPI